MMMPPMKVAQSAAPQEVAKEMRWASLAAVTAPVPERAPRRASGAKRTPAAKKQTATENRVAHPIARRQPSQKRRRAAVLGKVWDRGVGGTLQKTENGELTIEAGGLLVVVGTVRSSSRL
jgi:hypothetical protein